MRNSTAVTKYELRSGTIPCDDSWDVIVAGGGPAGCAAATAAAREGARTLLVEATGCLGGAATSGLVPAWCPFTDGDCKEAMPHVRGRIHGWLPLDPERLKRIYDDLVTGAGAQVRFQTSVCAVEADREGKVTAIVVADKSGLSAFRAEVYVDCTGDGDLCAWADAEYEVGDERGEVMPATLCFVLANVDTYAFHFQRRYKGSGWQPGSPMSDIIKSGRYPAIRDTHLCASIIGPGTVGFNAGHIWDIDSTNPVSTSQALIEGRRIAAAFRDALAEFDPEAFANAYLVATAPVVGVRESRRILGDYVLTLDDYMARRSFDDEICRNSYGIDIHVAKNEIERSRAGENVVGSRVEPYGKGESHGIPYRCLTPKGLKNVLVAGRSISCERTVQGSVRVMPVCLCMGEAAGIAAASAAQMHTPDVHNIEVQPLRARLKEAGSYLPSVKEGI